MSKLNISIIGAGLMGHGIAFIFRSAGHKVKVYDSDERALASLNSRISKISEDLGYSRANKFDISMSKTIKAVAINADVIIEAATEQLELKQEIFRELIINAPADCILATNTSGFPISQIAEGTDAPERIMGAHFFNPPHLMPLVEVIQSRFTDILFIERMLELLKSVGKTAVHVKKDIPGFIGNRLQHALKREAIALVENGICDAETIDLVVKEGFGLRLGVMGPLENSDMVGLDLTLSIHESLLPSLDASSSPQKLLLDKVRSGELGMGVGKGFRYWTPDQAATARERMNRYLIKNARERLKEKIKK